MTMVIFYIIPSKPVRQSEGQNIDLMNNILIKAESTISTINQIYWTQSLETDCDVPVFVLITFAYQRFSGKRAHVIVSCFIRL